MQLVTIGSRYQIVIPRQVRNKVKGLKPGAKVAIQSVDKGTITVRTKPNDWIGSYLGIAKKAWKGINTTKYLEDLRDEWDKKV